MRLKVGVNLLVMLMSFGVCLPAWCDQWTAALTPTSAQASNLNGALSVYVTTTQPVGIRRIAQRQMAGWPSTRCFPRSLWRWL